MHRLFRFSTAVPRDDTVAAWLDGHTGELGGITRHWFQVMRECGPDVRELMHDGYATACVTDAAFAYVRPFTAHANVGFFHGAELADPNGLLVGTGKFMRHVKLKPGAALDADALTALIETAYTDMQQRIKAAS